LIRLASSSLYNWASLPRMSVQCMCCNSVVIDRRDGDMRTVHEWCIVLKWSGRRHFRAWYANCRAWFCCMISFVFRPKRFFRFFFSKSRPCNKWHYSCTSTWAVRCVENVLNRLRRDSFLCLTLRCFSWARVRDQGHVCLCNCFIVLNYLYISACLIQYNKRVCNVTAWIVVPADISADISRSAEFRFYGHTA